MVYTHLVTYMDSIGEAIGAWRLYRSMPATAIDINSETKFVLELFGVSVSSTIEDIIAEDSDTKFCLVDY